MSIKLHKQAATTPKSRAEIQAAPASISDSELVCQYGVGDSTIRRWRYRNDVHDRPHTRHNLLATLTTEQSLPVPSCASASMTCWSWHASC